MPNRRVFLQTSAAVSAIAINGAIVRSAEALGAHYRVTLGKAIYDGRYTQGRRFAAVVAAHGVATRALDEGDITRFWYEELDTLWRHEPVALAGFAHTADVVIERFAAERGMRLTLRVEHRAERDGTLTHLVAGPRETVALAAELEGPGTDWPEVMAAIACRASGDGSPRETWHTGDAVFRDETRAGGLASDAGAFDHSLLHATSRCAGSWRAPRWAATTLGSLCRGMETETNCRPRPKVSVPPNSLRPCASSKPPSATSGCSQRRGRRALPRRVLAAVGEPEERVASAAVAPITVEQVQAVVRIANDVPHPALPDLDRQELRLRRLGAGSVRQRRARPQAHEPRSRGRRAQRVRARRARRELLRSLPPHPGAQAQGLDRLPRSRLGQPDRQRARSRRAATRRTRTAITSTRTAAWKSCCRTASSCAPAWARCRTRKTWQQYKYGFGPVGSTACSRRRTSASSRRWVSG